MGCQHCLYFISWQIKFSYASLTKEDTIYVYVCVSHSKRLKPWGYERMKYAILLWYLNSMYFPDFSTSFFIFLFFSYSSPKWARYSSLKIFCRYGPFWYYIVFVSLPRNLPFAYLRAIDQVMFSFLIFPQTKAVSGRPANSFSPTEHKILRKYLCYCFRKEHILEKMKTYLNCATALNFFITCFQVHCH